MRTFPWLLRKGYSLLLDGARHEIGDVYFETDEIELEVPATEGQDAVSPRRTTVRRPLSKVLAALRSGSVTLFDSNGAKVDLFDWSSDVLRLSEAKQGRHALRVKFVIAVRQLGNVGPQSAAFRAVVDATNRSLRTSFKASTVYAWVRRYLAEGGSSALATPRRTGPTARPPMRMHPLVREALDEVLEQETADLEQRLADQRRKVSVRGRTGLSLRAIRHRARARVEELHRERQRLISEAAVARGGAPPPSESVPDGPSNRTVQLEIYDELSRWNLLRAVYGKHVAQRRLGPHGASFRLTRICERWEVDLFIADVIVAVYYKGVLVPVGPPYILAMVDCYSGVWVGWVIEFRMPSFRSFLALLKQSMTPKDWVYSAFPGIKRPFMLFGSPEVTS